MLMRKEEPTGNTQATVMVVAEHAAETILALANSAGSSGDAARDVSDGGDGADENDCE